MMGKQGSIYNRGNCRLQIKLCVFMACLKQVGKEERKKKEKKREVQNIIMKIFALYL